MEVQGDFLDDGLGASSGGGRPDVVLTHHETNRTAICCDHAQASAARNRQVFSTSSIRC